jgi:hypothetical protein
MTQPQFSRPTSGWALFDVAPLLALFAAAGALIATGREAPRKDGPDLSQLSVGIKRGANHHYVFTTDDVQPLVSALANQGITSFVCYVDPDTGALDVVTAFDHKPHVDIKPGSCPNPVNVSHGAAAAAAVVPAALLGNAFDVTQIDISTVRISPVILQENGSDPDLPPVHISYDDVGAPFEPTDTCQCAALPPDGILDLVIHFDRQQMTDAFGLQSLQNNAQFPLKVTGVLNEGRGIFSGRDCIRILNH